MVESARVTLPGAGLPTSGQTDDEILAAAWRALGAGQRKPAQEGRPWAWITATLSQPQVEALAGWLRGLPAAPTITERLARSDALARLDAALASLE